MKVLIAGGTGFIGTALCRHLAARGHEVLVLTRAPERRPRREGIRYVAWETEEWGRALSGTDAVVNLAGESIVSMRWTPAFKARIRDSRIATTRRLVTAIEAASTRPRVLVNASAIGYYGACQDQELTEGAPVGTGFLAETCRAWEAEAARAECLGLRVVRLRIGPVLAPQAVVFQKMMPPFQWYIGGPLGSGRQWMSWVHQDDVVGLAAWILEHPALAGPVNVTAPRPVTMAEFCRVFGSVLHRPSWLPVPSVALRLLLGEQADMLLTGQRVLPAAALRSGYAFRHTDLRAALDACLRRPR